MASSFFFLPRTLRSQKMRALPRIVPFAASGSAAGAGGAAVFSATPGFSRAGSIRCIYVKDSVSALHITNGDSAAGTLRTFLVDPVVVTCDPLFEGPVPALDRRQWDSIAEAARSGEAITLWFEHDLYDQLLLIRALDRLSGGTNVSLICIDRFPGVDRFIGLGQLTADQLATLVDRKQPVTPELFAYASRAWAAFRGSDPAALMAFMSPGPLPFLGAALRRFFEEYPSTFNGVSRSASAVLRALESGPLGGTRLFTATQVGEERPFMGDWGVYDVALELSKARTPLVTIHPTPEPPELGRHTFTITDAGREVLAGRTDAVVLNGIDEWPG